MEFWGVEVKSGEPLKVDPGDDKIVHLSMASLGEVNKDKGSGPVSVYVKFGDQKLAIGTLSSDKFPQISYDLIFEKEFELSHDWKNGSVFFTGFKAESQSVSDNEDLDDFDGEYIPVNIANGKEIEVKNVAKADANGSKQKEKVTGPRKNGKAKETANGEDEEDSSEFESDEDSSEEEPMVNGGVESSEDDDDSDDNDDNDKESDDEETPKKAETSTKRALDSKKTPVPMKKAKFVTPQKTDGKSSGYVATPHPSKQTDKAAANNKQQTPKSGGDYRCKSCNRSFKTEEAINSHNKAKHSAK